MPPDRKAIASEFLRHAAAGRAQAEGRALVKADGVHHNPYFAAGWDALLKGMDDNARSNPHKRLDILHVIGEGEWVAVFSRVVHSPGDRGAAVVHHFRFEGDAIAELWDVGQAVPEKMANEDGMF